MTTDEMVVEDLEAMEDSGSTSSEPSGEAESGQQEDMEESDQEHEEKSTNPAFSKFMQGFWDLASVDVPVRCVALGCCCCTAILLV